MTHIIENKKFGDVRREWEENSKKTFYFIIKESTTDLEEFILGDAYDKYRKQWPDQYIAVRITKDNAIEYAACYSDFGTVKYSGDEEWHTAGYDVDDEEWFNEALNRLQKHRVTEKEACR